MLSVGYGDIVPTSKVYCYPRCTRKDSQYIIYVVCLYSTFVYSQHCWNNYIKYEI